MMEHNRPVGELLRHWRRHRRVSQLDLALDAEVSARHIRFLENGRSQPSRQMLLRLAEQLQLPLRDRNVLLAAAGYAPVYPRTPLEDPSLDAVRAAIDLVLSGHEPYPALAVDRYWNLIAANSAVASLLTGIDPALLDTPLNVLRVSLHPDGIAPRVVNLRTWRDHLLARLQRQVQVTADPKLAQLHDELQRYPVHDDEEAPAHSYGEFAIPLRLRTEGEILSFISTTTVFGAAHDVTLDELAIESFYPQDTVTRAAFSGPSHARRL